MVMIFACPPLAVVTSITGPGSSDGKTEIRVRIF
jgi:hypothetical protein